MAQAQPSRAGMRPVPGSEEVADRHDQSRSASSPDSCNAFRLTTRRRSWLNRRPGSLTNGLASSSPDPAGRCLRGGSTFGNHWITGAQQLSQKQRTATANDPLELLAVDGPTNAGKSDGDRDLAATDKGVPARTCRTADCLQQR